MHIWCMISGLCLLIQTLAKHVMNIHMNALQMSEEARPGELQLNTLKKYIAYCRTYVLLQFVSCLLQLCTGFTLLVLLSSAIVH